MRRAVLMVWCGAAACQRPAPPVSAYVWSRAWSATAHASLRQLPPEVDTLRVLLRERGPRGGWPPVDLASLRDVQRPIVAVVRIGPDGLTDDLAEERARLDEWRRAGIPAGQLEVDFDCAASQLGAYGEWLAALRPKLGEVRLSVTALPSWASAEGLAHALAPVDEVVLQVHAVQRPVLFDAERVVPAVHAFAQAARRAVVVALPAYRVPLEGALLAADPAEVATVARALARSADVSGLAYFRLGSDDDRGAWSPGTLAAVVRGDEAALVPHVALATSDVGAGTRDVWVVNEGRVDAPAPQSLEVSGGPAEGALGYEVRGATLVRPQPLWLRPGERVRVGEVLGTLGEAVDVRATKP